MPKPVYLMTVQEAHKEYNSLIDQLRAKFKQLDSGKFGAVGPLSFNPIYNELWHNNNNNNNNNFIFYHG